MWAISVFAVDDDGRTINNITNLIGERVVKLLFARADNAMFRGFNSRSQ